MYHLVCAIILSDNISCHFWNFLPSICLELAHMGGLSFVSSFSFVNIIHYSIIRCYLSDFSVLRSRTFSSSFMNVSAKGILACQPNVQFGNSTLDQNLVCQWLKVPVFSLIYQSSHQTRSSTTYNPICNSCGISLKQKTKKNSFLNLQETYFCNEFDEGEKSNWIENYVSMAVIFWESMRFSGNMVTCLIYFFQEKFWRNFFSSWERI